MRGARLLTLLVGMAAIAAMALGAQTAAALSVVTEPGNTACPAVVKPGAGGETDVDGGCLIHETGEFELRRHTFGIETHITKCKEEFHGRVNGSGEGWNLEQFYTHEPNTTSCDRQPCKDGTESEPWHMSWNQGTPQGDPEAEPNDTYGITTTCYEPEGGGANESCELDVGFNETAARHVYEWGHVEPGAGSEEMASHGVSGFRCERIEHYMTEVGGMHDGQNEQVVEIKP